MSESHPSDLTDSNSLNYVGNGFFQELECNSEPQNQTSEKHMIEELSNEKNCTTSRAIISGTFQEHNIKGPVHPICFFERSMPATT